MGRPCGQKYGRLASGRGRASTRVISSRCEMRVGLDGGVAGDEGERAVDERRRLVRAGAAHLVEQPLDQPARLLALEQHGHRAQQDGGSAEALEGEAELLERRVSIRGAGRPGPRPSSSGCGKSSSCDGSGLCSSWGSRQLEEHALVRHVLVDEEDLVVARRDDEGVLQLADHRAEAPRRRTRRVSSRNSAACGAARSKEGGPGDPPSTGPAIAPVSARRPCAPRPTRWSGPPGAGRRDCERSASCTAREDRLLHEARRAEAHPRLGRMDVDVDLAAAAARSRSAAAGNRSRARSMGR